jgi:hypothetical protein
VLLCNEYFFDTNACFFLCLPEIGPERRNKTGREVLKGESWCSPYELSRT